MTKQQRKIIEREFYRYKWNKYLVAGTLRENTYQGNTELQIVAEYIAPQPQIETNTKQGKQKDPFDDCDI